MPKSRKFATHHTRKKKVSKPKHVYSVMFGLDGSGGRIWVSEFADVELWTIGAITVQWAYLEHVLLTDTAARVNRAKLAQMPEYAESLSFKKRLAAWRQVIQETVKNKRNKERLLNLGHRIGNLEADRHKVTHGLWQWNAASAVKLEAWSFRPGVSFHDKHFSFDRLWKLMERIAQANFELSYPPPPKDKAKRQQWRARLLFGGGSTRKGTYTFAYVSRRLLLAAQGTKYATLVRPEDKHPKQPRPLSSSQRSPAA